MSEEMNVDNNENSAGEVEKEETVVEEPVVEEASEENVEEVEKTEAEIEVDAMVAKASPVVFAVMGLIAEVKPCLDIRSQAQLNDEYGKLVSAAILSCKDAGLTLQEIDWAMKRLAEVGMLVARQVGNSLEISRGKYVEKVCGKALEDMTLDEWDAVLVEAKADVV